MGRTDRALLRDPDVIRARLAWSGAVGQWRDIEAEVHRIRIGELPDRLSSPGVAATASRRQ